MKVFVVLSPGGEWSNDDFCSSGISGVYSSLEKAKAEIKNFMREECKIFDEASSSDDEQEDFDAMSFEDLQDRWCELTECNDFVIFERELDDDLLGIELAAEELVS